MMVGYHPTRCLPHVRYSPAHSVYRWFGFMFALGICTDVAGYHRIGLRVGYGMSCTDLAGNVRPGECGPVPTNPY
eukprot:746436-Rhodomonas_salina.2